MLNYGAATFEKQILCPSRDFTFPHSQGSNPEVRECGREVGFTPDIVAKVENRATRNISRKLIFGLLRSCVAFQRHCGGS
jgi:hypothetical protein